jgi:hypothetical protein
MCVCVRVCAAGGVVRVVVWVLLRAAKSIHYLVFPGGPPPEY